ncbi:MAG: hypothetical protein WC749_02060 [Dehalococcoidia bacterium]
MADEPCPKKALEVFRPILGVIFLLGTFTIAAFIFSGKVDANWASVASSFLGSLLTGVMLILTWAYGSSKGSETKTEMMVDTAKTTAAATIETAKVLAAAEVAEKK